MCRQFCPFKVLVSLCAIHFAASTLPAQELDVHIRVSWGEGARRLWKGSIRMSEGVVSEPRCLGIDADSPNDLELVDGTLKFFQRMPVSFDGLDVRVAGPRDAMLIVELVPEDAPAAAKKVEIRLSEFTSATPIVHNSQLDDRQNRLQLQRAPGDRLRVQFDRDSLVFSPGESFAFDVLPHALGLDEGTAVRCAMQLVSAGDEEVLWKEPHHDLKVDADGQTPPIGPVKLTVPEAEGVYDIVITLNLRRFSDAIVPTKPTMVRKIQLIVIDDKPRLSEATDWRLVEEIDSANPKWWDRLIWLPQWTKLRGSAPHGPLGDPPLQKREFGNGVVHEIGPAGWHAAPIPIANVGEPHILEIEYPRGFRQTLGISILEPNAAEQVGTQGLDSGVDVRGETLDANATTETHRLIFWPRGKTPWLLLTNRRDDAPAVFRSIRVYAGPTQLPAIADTPRNGEGRMAIAYFDKPIFPDNFGASEALDALSNRSLRDWTTFYVGAVRLAEYLKYAGYDAAFLPVACDGSTLYPTRMFDTTPKYDNGAFFVSGQDPLPKDVLEMLLRIFDREGLKLIPTVQFGTPIPELDELTRGKGTAMGGIPLVGTFPNGSRAALASADAPRGQSPYYNPLDARVQTAMRRIAAEIIQRSQPHPSFAGLGLQLTPYGYAQLPDDTWALDDTTFSRFLKQTNTPPPTGGADVYAARLAAVRGPLRSTWLAWRAARIAEFYQQLQEDVANANPAAQLYLQMHELTAGRVVQDAIRPQLPARADFNDAMLRHGLDTGALGKLNGTVVLRPQRLGPLTSLSSQATNVELEQSSLIDQQFQSARPAGTLVYHEPQMLRLPAFDTASPWGSKKTYTRLAASVSPSGSDARARLVRSLIALDIEMFASGGRTIPIGQEDSLRPLLRALRQLPAKPFETARPKSAKHDTPNVAVRSLNENGKTWIYAANATGMAVKVHIELQNCPNYAAVEMATADQSPLVRVSPNNNTWAAQLEPYDFVAFFVGAPEVKVSDWRVEFNSGDVAGLERVVQDLRARVSGLRVPRRLDALENPDFEQTDAAGRIVGWTWTEKPGVTAALDATVAHSGQSSLHLRVNAPATQAQLRSNPFPVPKTGRISVLARIRTNDIRQQPPLRISIDVKNADGTSYSRPSRQLGTSLPVDWSGEFLFHVVNLPPATPGEMTVGFDLMGPGEVWIDDVQVFDLFFQEVEQNELLKNVANAQLQLQKREFAACQRFLHTYWPRFVLEYAPLPRLAQVVPAESRSRGITPAKAAPEPPEQKPFGLNRFIPKPPFKLPLP